MRRALVLVLVVTACGAEPAAHDPYRPAHLDAEAEHITFTTEGARRTGLETAPVRRRGAHVVVPYTALVYDGEGESFVYTSPEPLTFVRARVAVERIDGDEVLLTSGPPPGTAVVTVGATQVYGTELGIAGGH